jgi:hypothetical protein
MRASSLDRGYVVDGQSRIHFFHEIFNGGDQRFSRPILVDNQRLITIGFCGLGA